MRLADPEQDRKVPGGPECQDQEQWLAAAGGWRRRAPSGSRDGACDRRRRRAPFGGSEEAAADRLGLSHSTVKHHVANARSA